MSPIKFHDFSADKANNYCGFGLKSVSKIKKGEEIVKMSLTMGMVSNVMAEGLQAEGGGTDEDQEMHDALMRNTRGVSKAFFPTHPV